MESLSTFPFSEGLWLFEILFGIAVLISVNLLFTKVIKNVRQRSLSTKPSWKERIDQIFSVPFHILLWLFGITLVAEVLGKRFGFAFFDNYLNAFRSSGFVLCTSWIFLRWKTELEHHFLSKDRQHGKRIDAGFIQVLSKISSVVVVILSLLITLQIWGLNIVPLIAFGGIGAAAIGFAAKDVIANFFGGLMLYINRPFMIGDLILIPDHKLEGHVEEMGWYLTCVRDKEKRPVYLANATFSHGLVINSSRMTHRRIEERIPIRHGDFSKVEKAIERMRAALSAYADIDTHLPVIIVLNTLNAQQLELYLDVYTLQTRYEKYLHVRQEILILVYEILREEGMEMPATSIHVALQDPSALLEQLRK